MPRAKKTDKFFHKLSSKSGEWKNKILIGVNHNYKTPDDITLEDLIAYLVENNIPLNSIKVPDIMFISKTS
jgi:hypothetical protein